MTLLLQTYERCSDAEARERAAYDQRWKVALGSRGPGETVHQEHAAAVPRPTCCSKRRLVCRSSAAWRSPQRAPEAQRVVNFADRVWSDSVIGVRIGSREVFGHIVDQEVGAKCLSRPTAIERGKLLLRGHGCTGG